MRKQFNIVYNRLKEVKLDENILCRPFWKKILELHQSFDDQKCWDLMTENIEWLLKARKWYKEQYDIDVKTDILTSKELIDWFTEEELNAHNIFTKGYQHISNKRVIGLADVTLEVDGHSEVILFDTAHAICGDTTFVKGYDNSSFVVSDCIGYAFENCNAQATGISIVENWSTNEVKKGRNCVVVNR